MIGSWTRNQTRDGFDALGLRQLGDDFLKASYEGAVADMKRYETAIEDVIATQTADHWERTLNAAHVPCARVRRIEETLAEAQVASRGVLGTVPGQSHGPGQLPVAAFTYAHGGPALQGPPPGFGEHTTEVLKDLGMTDQEITALRKSGAIG